MVDLPWRQVMLMMRSRCGALGGGCGAGIAMTPTRSKWALLAAVLGACQPETVNLEGVGGLVAQSTEGPEVDVPPLDPTPDGTGDGVTSEPDPGMLVDAELLPAPEPVGDFDTRPQPLAREPGCTKIDFLFVIDNSDSMDEEQDTLVTSFPGFIDVLLETSEAKDYHIMVVGTDGDTEEVDEPTTEVEDCSEVRGAGRRVDENGDDCGIDGGSSFMSESQADLTGTFSCVARVGTDGSAFEETVDSMLDAIGTELNAPGRCNDGFLRKDAVLVVTVITDEEDDRSDFDPPDWRSRLLAAKGGDENALVVLGLVGDDNLDDGLPGGPCPRGDADGAPRLQEFVGSFGEHGLLGSVCAPDYTTFFSSAVESIDGACRDFVPPVLF
jgi:hypothetical protein